MATLDTSIYQNLLRPKSSAEFATERQAQELNALKLLQAQQQSQEQQRQVGEQVRLRGLAGGWGAQTTEEQRIADLKNAGFFSQADALEKAFLERQKTTAEVGSKEATTAQTRQKTKQETREYAITGLQTLQDPGSARDYINRGVSQGYWDMPTAQQMLASIPADPNKYQDWRINQLRTILPAKEQLPKLGQQNLGGQLQLTAQDVLTGAPTVTGAYTTTMGPGEAARLAEERRQFGIREARESAQANQGVTYETDAAGNLVAVPNRVAPGAAVTSRPVVDQAGKPLAGKGKPMTEDQAKALLYGSRMQESDKIIDTLAEKGTSSPSFAQQLTGGQGMIGRAATAAAAPEQQQVDQAQRDFINAALRRESGAAISPTEFESARLQYFVQPGDSKAVKAQKAANRQLAIKGMLVAVPEGMRTSLSQPTAQSGGPSRIANDAEYTALPSGATFIGPDGKTRRKP